MKNILILLTFIPAAVFAQNYQTKLSPKVSPEFIENLYAPRTESSTHRDWNFRTTSIVARPIADYEPMKYLFMFGLPEYLHEDYDAFKTQTKIIENLPAGMHVILLIKDDPDSEIIKIENHYRPFIGKNKLSSLKMRKGESAFWSRDALPIPVVTSTNLPALIDAAYTISWDIFESDDLVGKAVGYPVYKIPNDIAYEGGNLQVDTKGNCFVVNAKTAPQMSDGIFQTYYGCKSVTRLKYLTGIGHVDEVLSIVRDGLAFTSHAQYVPQLEAKGFEVWILPKPKVANGSYANVLIINNHVFLPMYDELNDQVAIDLYTRAGFKVIPVKSKRLSELSGNIHCITMAYP